jgi:hypothetical protein
MKILPHCLNIVSAQLENSHILYFKNHIAPSSYSVTDFPITTMDSSTSFPNEAAPAPAAPAARARPRWIKIPKKLENDFVLVAPPSPLFEGVNQDINTEPFPEFEDSPLLSTSSPPEPLHCVLHCDEKVCKHLQGLRRAIPPCRCASESAADEPLSELQTEEQQRPRQPMNVDRYRYHTEHAQELLKSASPDTEIEIYLPEALAQLNYLADKTTEQALENEGFLEAMQATLPDQEEENYLAHRTVAQFFDIMILYFSRTVQPTGHRIVKLKQLQLELDAYLWTTLRDWVEDHCDDATGDRILTCIGTDCFRRAEAVGGAPAAVLALWRECMQDVLQMLVLRDEEAKRNQGGNLFLLVLAIAVFLWTVS